ncbi:hypothetical protein QVD17_12232 [Tagetes erecta]|uniref:Uncharacterized protein n=1 Tax=Tagetes erecta TaxID=13708 RepID=A0AAD8P2N1_TARER|nr:hypothetical protein QVD17_12232 [Tagetes erecta]
MIGAPTSETSDIDAYKKNPAYDAKHFWESITVKSMKRGSNAKASQIVHLVLRVAHRVISCIIDIRLDSGSVTKDELYLLWCMINPQPTPPNFGHYLCHKLLQAADAEKGDIFGSSIITILGQHDSLHLTFPNGMETVSRPRYLDMDQMMKMKMFQQSTMHPGQIWLFGTHHYRHFMVEETKKEAGTSAASSTTVVSLSYSLQRIEDDATSSAWGEA